MKDSRRALEPQEPHFNHADESVIDVASTACQSVGSHRQGWKMFTHGFDRVDYQNQPGRHCRNICLVKCDSAAASNIFSSPWLSFFQAVDKAAIPSFERKVRRHKKD